MPRGVPGLTPARRCHAAFRQGRVILLPKLCWRSAGKKWEHLKIIIAVYIFNKKKLCKRLKDSAVVMQILLWLVAVSEVPVGKFKVS